MFATDSSSERATSIEDYQNTCTEFIIDISRDYKDWVDRYQLSKEETNKRKESIDRIVATTNNWIRNFGNTIKKVDVVMNDGINKMAESTAGYPFQFEVSVNSQKRYAKHTQGRIAIRVNAIPQAERTIIFELPLGTIYQLPILTMVNMMAGIFGSPDGAILRRPQP